MSRADRVDVMNLRPGQVIVCAHNVTEDALGWLVYPPGLSTSSAFAFVGLTVESVTPLGHEGETVAHGGEDPPSWAQLHDIALLYNGDRVQVTARGSDRVTVLPAHHPRCGECGEVWPCRDERVGFEAAQMTAALDDVCAHCGKAIGGAWDVRISDGVTERRFHQAKKYRAGGKLCRVAAEEARRSISGVEP